jgi:1,4-dihydroxy-6-naphthoate synthase
MSMNIAYSPCPNDTFIFHAWAHDLIADSPKLHVTHADIDHTNEWAIQTNPSYDLLKISYAALPSALKNYGLLPCGGALGEGCGPLLLCKGDSTQFHAKKRLKIAVPSERSTAFLLFRLWLTKYRNVDDFEIVVIPFEQIMPAVVRGQFDAGLVIHEARFTYPSYGLTLLVDLGNWWEAQTGFLIPLGAIIAKRDQDAELLTHCIRQSLAYAWQNPAASKEYIRSHAQEWSPDVTNAHIQLYVNQNSMNIDERGKQSIYHLFEQSIATRILPSFDFSDLWLC